MLDEISKIINSKDLFEADYSRTFIIQEYLEKPFLYNRRKFDLRCYMLLVNIVTIYNI